MECSWGEAALLVESFTTDSTSHLGAAAAGWHWPASMTDVALTLLAQGVLTTLMPEGKSVEFPLPWQEMTGPEQVAPELVDELRERLAQFSAFND